MDIFSQTEIKKFETSITKTDVLKRVVVLCVLGILFAAVASWKFYLAIQSSAVLNSSVWHLMWQKPEYGQLYPVTFIIAKSQVYESGYYK